MPDAGRHVLVAGVDRGSGAGIAESFREKGWLVSECTVEAAIEDPAGVLDTAVAAQGPLHAAVANHLGYDFLPGETAASGYDWPRDLKGLLDFAGEALPRLGAAGGGALVSVTYTSHFVDPDDLTGLAAAKGAVVGATRALAVEAGPTSRVISITPGFVLTPRVESRLDEMEPGERDAFLGNVVERTPMRRAGRPADVGAICAWLASERASFVTGVDVVSDGGELSLNRTFSYNPPAEPEEGAA